MLRKLAGNISKSGVDDVLKSHASNVEDEIKSQYNQLKFFAKLYIILGGLVLTTIIGLVGTVIYKLITL